MAFLQNYKQHHTPLNNALIHQEHNKSVSSLNTQLAGNNTSVLLSTSTSGVQSDWIVFEPDRDRRDILSDSNSHEDLLNTDDEDIGYDDDEDDDSLLESLETQYIVDSSLNEFNLASGSSASYKIHSNDYAQSLQNDDFINTRIDCWRKEQAKVLIDDLYGITGDQNEIEDVNRSNDLLLSWGVEETANNKQQASLKRFYGDDLFRDYTSSEISKISTVTKSLSTSLTRDPIYSTYYNKEASFLFQLSNNANKYTIQDSYSLINEGLMDDMMARSSGLFWEQDLRSTQSSITADSVMQLGNLNTLDVF